MLHSFKKNFKIDFERERRGRGEREGLREGRRERDRGVGERHPHVSETLIGCHLHMLQSGIKPTAYACAMTGS